MDEQNGGKGEIVGEGKKEGLAAVSWMYAPFIPWEGAHNDMVTR